MNEDEITLGPAIPCDPAFHLAMLDLQSDRYTTDAEYRCAVDDVLAWVRAAREHTAKVYEKPA